MIAKFHTGNGWAYHVCNTIETVSGFVDIPDPTNGDGYVFHGKVYSEEQNRNWDEEFPDSKLRGGQCRMARLDVNTSSDNAVYYSGPAYLMNDNGDTICRL